MTWRRKLGASLLPAALWAQATYEPPPEQLPRVVPAQPVAFSHKAHMDQRMACTDCHPGAARAERAGVPQRDDCMVCHQAIATDNAAVRELAAMAPGSRIRWERVYQVPDYVFFSHGEHSRAGLDCVTCHGPVASRTVLDQEISTNMVACMNCHAERKASVECFLCHDLGQ
ncbi:MAG: cytochrome c3 family protein [Bryobacterales bacterium]|nr:cytochrome c3 family protein [Bryobacterales bacterium]